MFHECNCGIKELQITYLSNKIRNACAFQASGHFLERRGHSKTPAENRMDCTL